MIYKTLPLVVKVPRKTDKYFVEAAAELPLVDFELFVSNKQTADWKQMQVLQEFRIWNKRKPRLLIDSHNFYKT